MTGTAGARSGHSVSIRTLAVIVLAGTLSLGAPTSVQVRYDHEHFWSTPSAFAGESNALIRHVIAPQATDPRIDQALDDHYAWIDTNVPTNHQLFVYLPGTDGVPENPLLVQQECGKGQRRGRVRREHQ